MKENLRRIIQVMLPDGDEHQEVSTRSGLGFHLHGVDGITKKVLNHKVLCELLEERLDLLGALVYRCDLQRRGFEQVREDHQAHVLVSGWRNEVQRKRGRMRFWSSV